MKKYALGIGCLVLAVLLLLQGNFGLPDMDWRIWPVLGSLFFVYHAIKNLARRHFSLGVFQAFIAFVILNKFFELVAISTGVLIGAGLLIVIGLNLLFKPKWVRYQSYTTSNKWQDWQSDYQDAKKTDVMFSSGTRYIHSENFMFEKAEVDFGHSEIYFDHAVIQEDEAVFEVEVNFGNMTLYIPRYWGLELRINNNFGHIATPVSTESPLKRLIVKGDVNFGQLKIVYI